MESLCVVSTAPFAEWLESKPAEYALRLSRATDATPEYWPLLQARHDLAMVGKAREGLRRTTSSSALAPALRRAKARTACGWVDSVDRCA
jgi:hypothetical protein